MPQPLVRITHAVTASLGFQLLKTLGRLPQAGPSRLSRLPPPPAALPTPLARLPSRLPASPASPRTPPRPAPPPLGPRVWPWLSQLPSPSRLPSQPLPALPGWARLRWRPVGPGRVLARRGLRRPLSLVLLLLLSLL